MTQKLNDLRARDARQKGAFYSGQSDHHPHGASGRRFILPPEDDKRCLDTAPARHAFSEWGNNAGFDI